MFFLRAMLCLLTLATLWVPAGAQVARPIVGREEEYTAVEGEDLLDIAMRFELAIDHLCFANGWPLTATRIYPGTRVLVPRRRVLPADPPRNGVVINLPERGLFLFRNGQFVKFYPISIGQKGRFQTPTGYYSIDTKVVNPTWYPPAWAKEKKPVPPGKDNPLGDRWIGLAGTRFGIHSTSNPINIGMNVTHGCIRCYPSLIHELYDRVLPGMPVRIEYETAKLGKDGNGGLFLITFPDVYGGQDPVKAARDLFARAGLVWSPDLEKQAGATRGVPIPVPR